MIPSIENISLQNSSEILKRVSGLTLKKFLYKILCNDERLMQLAANAYAHQLGFEKYVIFKSKTGVWIRLHFWPKDGIIANEDIHSHCAPFTSKIIKGGFSHSIFELTSGKTHMKYIYGFDEESGKSGISGGELVSILPKNVQNFGVNEIYTVDTSTLHTVTNIQQHTITLSIWGSRNYDAVVVKDLESKAEDCNRKAGMRKRFIQERLGKIINLIEG